MSNFLKVLIAFFQVLYQTLTFFNIKQIREDGERKVILENLEESNKQKEVSDEIENRVDTDGFSSGDLERMRKYKRK